MNGLRGKSCASSLNKKPAVVIKNNSMVRAKRATYQPSKPQAVDELVVKAPRAQLVKDTRPSFTCMLDTPVTLAATPAASPVFASKSLLFPFDDGFVPIFRSSCVSAPASASTTQVGPSEGDKKRPPIKMKINKTKDTSANNGTGFQCVSIVACPSPNTIAAAGPPPAPHKAQASLAREGRKLQRVESMSFEELLASCYEEEEEGTTTAAPIIEPVTVTASNSTGILCVPITACPSPSAIAAAGPPPAPLKAQAPLALEDPELQRLESLSFEQLLDACLGQEEEEEEKDTASKAPLPNPSAPEAFTIPACSLLPGAMICPITGASEAPDTIMEDVEEEPFFEVDGEGDVIMTEADPIELQSTYSCFMAPPPLVVGFTFALPKPVVEVPPVDPMTTLGLPPFSSLDDLRSSLKMPPAPIKPPRAASSWDHSLSPLAFSPRLALAEDATTAESTKPVARKARKIICTEGPAFNTRSTSRRDSAIAYRTRARSIW